MAWSFNWFWKTYLFVYFFCIFFYLPFFYIFHSMLEISWYPIYNSCSFTQFLFFSLLVTIFSNDLFLFTNLLLFCVYTIVKPLFLVLTFSYCIFSSNISIWFFCKNNTSFFQNPSCCLQFLEKINIWISYKNIDLLPRLQFWKFHLVSSYSNQFLIKCWIYYLKTIEIIWDLSKDDLPFLLEGS